MMIKTNITKWLRIFLQYVGLYPTFERQRLTEEMVLIQEVGRGMSTDYDVYSGMDFWPDGKTNKQWDSW